MMDRTVACPAVARERGDQLGRTECGRLLNPCGRWLLDEATHPRTRCARAHGSSGGRDKRDTASEENPVERAEHRLTQTDGERGTWRHRQGLFAALCRQPPPLADKCPRYDHRNELNLLVILCSSVNRDSIWFTCLSRSQVGWFANFGDRVVD